MGTGHSVDTPIRVAPLGISSVISLVDDLLFEKIRHFYCTKYELPYSKIPKNREDGRAERITAYLNTVCEIVRIKTEAIKKYPFFKNNDKAKYFELLPDDSPIKNDYRKLLKTKEGPEREAIEKYLTLKMKPGSIDVNIMVKLDRNSINSNGDPLNSKFSDAKAALRGYANSVLRSSIIFSAGLNQSLFTYMTMFHDFYRDKTGDIKKKVILKVSDFRSALIQGKFLAKKGLEVFEFRIESGLNCGGHAFPSNGNLLPSLLQEFMDKRDQLVKVFQPLIQKYYRNKNWKYPESAMDNRPLITVQGGIGTYGEVCRLIEDFHIDGTGCASPFLLVPEATCVDDSTRKLLKQAKENDLYLSDVSPLGFPFNNLHKTGSEVWTHKRLEAGDPGSHCPNGFLASNTEFTDKSICAASRQYQKRKLEMINNLAISDDEKKRLRKEIVEKTCICNHLGNGSLIALGIVKEEDAPQSICPGPDIVWFNKYYTLKEMVDHIYGRGPSLVSPERPHMFSKEIVMYVDYFAKQVSRCTYTTNEIKSLQEFKDNLEDGMDFCLSIAKKKPYPAENLASLATSVERERKRLVPIHAEFKNKAGIN